MQVTNLAAYLANIKMTHKEFAQLIGCEKSYFSQICSGKIRPGPKLRRHIFDLTDGIVNLENAPKNPSKKTIKKKEEISG